MKWPIWLFMIAMVVGCNQAPLVSEAQQLDPGIYDAHIEGDFFGLTGVDDSSETVVDPSFQVEPANTLIHIVGRKGDQQAMHIFWIEQDIRQMWPGHYEYRFDPDDFGASPVGVNICLLDSEGVMLLDAPATIITVDVAASDEGGMVYQFEALLPVNEQIQRSASGFHLIE